MVIPMLLGVDPGLGGALAWLHDGGSLAALADMPVLNGEVDCHALADLVRDHDEVKGAILEWPGVMPINGAMTQRSIGMTLGTLTAVLGLAEVPIHRVPPSGWKRAIGIKGKTRPDRNNAARALATRLWPGWSEQFRRVKDADRAEAALLVHWYIEKARRS